MFFQRFSDKSDRIFFRRIEKERPRSREPSAKKNGELENGVIAQKPTPAMPQARHRDPIRIMPAFPFDSTGGEDFFLHQQQVYSFAMIAHDEKGLTGTAFFGRGRIEYLVDQPFTVFGSARHEEQHACS